MSARSTARTRRSASASKTGQVRIQEKALDQICPSPENDRLYKPVVSDDPEIIELANSIARDGVLEPLVISEDGYILSGHRRYAAARQALLRTVPCRVVAVRRSDDADRFVALLREYNRQREKTNDERLREELVTVNPHEAYEALLAHRAKKSLVDVAVIDLKEHKRRSTISEAKQPMLEAVKRVLDELRPFWPVSERKIHYKLLNNPPLRHASKPASVYQNNRKCSQDLSDLCTRARLTGDIPFEAIGDETRPRAKWATFENPRQFLRQELNGMFKGYWRNLQASQPNHLHIFAEKNTVFSILQDVASEFCIPMTSGRGFSSHEPIHEIASSYFQSGKESLVLLVASDFDPSGEAIAESFCRNLRDDYGVERIVPVKFALTYEQTQRMDLPVSIDAKPSDSRYADFTSRYGTESHELEAVDELALQQMLRNAIDSVMDISAFNAELEAEKQDASFLAGARMRAQGALKGIFDADADLN